MKNEMTGPERVREAIERDRGGHLAPQLPVTICGQPDGTEMRADDPRWPGNRTTEPCPSITERTLGLLVCPGCFGLRFGPIHLSRKLLGIDCQHT